MRFERKTVDDWWADLQSKGVALDREMLWGFFLVGEDEPTLQALVPLLEAQAYEYVTILKGDSLHLHVQRAERTTQADLHARALQLHELGEAHGVDFDGWDVGNVDGSILY